MTCDPLSQALGEQPGSGVSCEYEGLSPHSVVAENRILVEFCGVLSRHVEQ